MITAWGRLGHWFGSERYEIEPDLITFAKGITSGYLPLAGLIVGTMVQEPFWQAPGLTWRHGYTYSGHAAACAAAIANLDIFVAEDLVESTRRREAEWREAVASLSSHPAVGEVRAVGLTAAVQLAGEALSEDPGSSEVVLRNARQAGVLTRLLPGPSVHLSPPLVITSSEIRDLIHALRRALDAATSTTR